MCVVSEKTRLSRALTYTNLGSINVSPEVTSMI